MRVTRMLAAAALTACVAVPLLVTTATAAPPAGTLGTLSVSPESGSDIGAIKVTTSGGCSEDSDAYNVQVTGPGKFADGFLITTTQASGFSKTDPFDIFFGLTMKDAATELGTTLVAGEYPVIARCVDEFLGDVKGTFTTSLIFTSPTEWHVGEGGGTTTTTTTTGSTTTTTTSDETTTTDETTTDETTTSTEPPITEPTDTPVDEPAPQGSPAPTGGLAQTGAPVGWVFVGGLFLVVLGSIYVLAAQRRRA